MPAACLMLSVVALAVHGHGPSLTASVDFSGTIEPVSELAVSTHDLGSGIVSHVAIYREAHTQEMRNETVETLAMAGDCVDFDATTMLAARRHRHDTWPIAHETLLAMVR